MSAVIRTSLAILCAAFALSLSAQTVPADFFGMHMDVGPTNGGTSVLAPITVGAHGKAAVTDWEYIETARGTYNFAALDTAVAYAKAKGVPIFVSHEWIARFATSDTATCAVNGLGTNQCSAAPADLHTSAPCQGSLTGTTTTDCMWKEFLTTLVQRYKSTGTQTGCSGGDPQCHGVIQMYEGWNEPPYPTPMAIADFVAFETDFVNTVRANDANAKVGSPAFIIDPAFPSYAAFMTSFFANGGPTNYDSYGFHINSAQPESQIALINQFKAILTTAGVSSPTIYATEAGRGWSCNEPPPSSAVQQAYAGRIEPIYWANGIKRHYWYAYSICGPISNQTSSNTLTPLGVAYGNVERWMLGSTMGTLTMTGPSPTNATFTAPLTNGAITNIIAWNSGAGASYTPPSRYTSYKDLNGATHAVSGSVALTNSPILLSVGPAVDSAQWSMGFLESAQDPAQRALVNYSAVTHVIDFGVHPASNGTLTCDFGSELCNSSAFTTARADLISTAHSHGVKVLMCVTDANGAGGFAGAASSGTLSTFVANIMSMVNTNGYDGVDLDWEASSYTTLMPGLISSLRTALGSTRLLAVDAIPGTQAFWASNYSVLDRVNFMTYDQEGNWNPYTWFNAALFSDSGDGVWSLDLMKRRAIAAGIPAAKINLGIPFYGYRQTGPTGPRQSVAGDPPLTQITYRSIVTTYPSQVASPTVDSVAKVPWFSITGGWVEYDNPASVTAKVNYIKAQSLGGWILFSLNKDASGQPLAAAVASAMGGGGGPTVPTISSFTASPSTITSGGSSTLSWSVSGADSVSINQGVGAVGLIGSTSVSPSTTLIYTLTATNSAGSVTQSVTVNVTATTTGTYYISNSAGSDSNDGLSVARPWKTINKVNSHSFAPGNQVLFQRGNTWSGTALVPSASGTSSLRIIYGAYDAGPNPIIDGGGSLSYAVQNFKDYITFNSLEFRNTRSALVNFTGANGTQFLNITGRNGGLRGLYGGFLTGNTVIDHLNYSDDSSHTTSSNIVEIWQDCSTTVSVTNSVFDRSLSPGTVAGLSVAVNGGCNGTYRYNKVFGGGQGIGVKPYHNSSGQNCPSGFNPATTNNLIADNEFRGVRRYGSSGIDGESAEVEGCSVSIPQSNTTIARNIFYPVSDSRPYWGSSNAIGTYFANGADIYGNVIIGACQQGTPETSNPGCIRLQSNSVNMHVHNNTLVGSHPDGRTYGAIEFFPGGTGVVANNIISNFGIGILMGASNSSATEHHNIFDVNVTTPYTGSGSLTHSGGSLTNTDPKFAVAPPISANDVKLQATSPAIGAGATLGSPYNLILGMGGTSSPYPLFTQTVPYADGAFGYGPGTGGGPPGSPSISSFTASPTTVASGSPSILTWVTTDADTLSIDNGIGPVTGGSSSIAVSPSITTTYILTATNTNGSNTASATVTVAVPVAPVIESFTAFPDSIPSDHLSALEWVVDGADSISIDQGIGDVSDQNFYLVRLRTTTTFTLTATNEVGSTTATVTVDVFTPVGPAAENIRYHQVRQYDRRGKGHEFQMYGGWPPPLPNYPAIYNADENVIPAQPRGTDSTVVQMADSTKNAVPGHVAVFDEKLRVKDGGAFPGQGPDGCGTWYQEEPIGTRDTANTTFALTYEPSSPYVILAVNGVVQHPFPVEDRPPEYVLAGNQVLMNVAPAASDAFLISYFACVSPPPLPGSPPPSPPPPPPPPPPVVPSSGTIEVWAQYFNDGGTASGSGNIQYSVNGGTTWNPGLGTVAGVPSGTFSEQVIDFTISGITDLSLIKVRFSNGGSIGHNGPLDHFYIYDVGFLTDHGTIRPTAAEVITGTTGIFIINAGGVSNPTNAFDDEASSPPTTHADVFRGFFGFLSAGPSLVVSGFGE